MHKRFWNYKTLGEGQVVYVLESGCDMDHPEITNVTFQDWIFAGGFPDDEQNEVYTDNGYHGTPVVGRVAGKNTGVAQKASIVVVKYVDGRGEWIPEYTLDGLIRIHDHILRNNAHRNCIINISLSYTPARERQIFVADYETNYEEVLQDVIDALMELPNVIMVVGSGNEDPLVYKPAFRSKFVYNDEKPT
ncbi:Secreted subtilisin-like serine protease sub9 [Orbilia brochopaga]|uniref:Secreted subtilisin-like serine protease sub9 n=1 Tax=Orbilia brochopaga TaxID=3140254 RepID=A0AAV9UI86_9PEZI